MENNRTVSVKKQREEGATDLKEMELHSSGLSSSVIQLYWNNVLSCYYNVNEEVRTDTMQVIWQTLQQGLVTPGSSIPTLIAMCTDSVSIIRVRAEQLLKETDAKNGVMVASKAISGVRMAFRLQKQITDANKTVRGIRPRDNTAPTQLDANTGLPKLFNDTEALLRCLYVSYRSSRPQRRAFLSNLLKLFSENTREKLTIDEWIFIADNIAHFPYQVMDEPLYVIHLADTIISIAGQNILTAVREIIYPGRAAPDSDDVSDLTTDKIYGQMPEDKTQLYELKHNSQACYILLCVKSYLMRAYSFKEDKLKEYSPSVAAKVYDKALTRRNISVFTPESAIRELKADDNRNTLEGHIKLAEHFDAFNRMFMQLDLNDDVDRDEETTTNVPPDEETEDVEGETLPDANC
jgi:cohesin loading factor subunit SCC2